MTLKTLKLTMIAFSAFLLMGVISCSDDSGEYPVEDLENGVISNGDITLTYGKELLNSFVTLSNSQIQFNKPSGGVDPVDIPEFEYPDLSGAIELTGTGWPNLQDNTTYYVAEGNTYTGGVNFGNNNTLYVLGDIGNKQLTIANNAHIIVGPNGQIPANLTLTNSTIDNYGEMTGNSIQIGQSGRINNYNFLANSQLNDISAQLYNYESSTSTSAGINGYIENRGTFTFTNAYGTTINQSGKVANFCSLTFESKLTVAGSLKNQAYIEMKGGLMVNDGQSVGVYLNDGSLTDITGGAIAVNKTITNYEGGMARVDIYNTSLGWSNANPAFDGGIDINSDLDLSNVPNGQFTIGEDVVLNGNIYVGDGECIPQRGETSCNDNALEFTLVAHVASPEIDGKILSATGVDVKDGKAYVSYHTNDDVYGNVPYGSVRVFDIQNSTNPSLIAQADFFNAEFNGVDVSAAGDMYAVGGNKAGARIVTYPLLDGAFDTEDLSAFQTFKAPSLGAKNSFMHNSMLWLVSGSTDGGFFKLDPNNDYEISEQLYAEGAKAKYVVQNGQYQAFFAAEANGAYLRISNMDGTNANEYSYSSLKQTVTTGKNAITMDDEFVYLALSDKGVAKIRLSDGELVSHYEPREATDSDGNNLFHGNTNAVTVDGCYIYLANGGDGVIVLNKNSFSFVGSYQLAQSSNFIYAEDGVIFVATGRDGLNIIVQN